MGGVSNNPNGGWNLCGGVFLKLAAWERMEETEQECMCGHCEEHGEHPGHAPEGGDEDQGLRAPAARRGGRRRRRPVSSKSFRRDGRGRFSDPFRFYCD